MSRERRIVDGEITLVPYYPNYAASLPWYQDPALCRQVDNRGGVYELDGRIIQNFCEQEIRDFYGYAFAAETPAFLAAVIGGLPEVSLELLYRQNPAWAALSLD